MKLVYPLLILLGFLAVQAAAQVVAQDEARDRAEHQAVAESATQREQRRMSLRAALKQQPQVPVSIEPRKQFSEQERHALRQQIREQQHAGKAGP